MLYFPLRTYAKDHHEPRQADFFQLMAFLPLSTFRRCAAKHRGDRKVQNFTCMDQFLNMAFAPLTYRKSLRDIEINSRAQAKRLYHMGLRCKSVSRNTLANANATRPWQIYADFAQHLIAMARSLFAQDPFGDRLGRNSLRLRYHDDRFVPVCLPLGAVSRAQSSYQTAHLARFARRHTYKGTSKCASSMAKSDKLNHCWWK